MQQGKLPMLESIGLGKFQIGFSHGNQVGKHISYPLLLTPLPPGKVCLVAKCRKSFCPTFVGNTGHSVQQNCRLGEIFRIVACLQ